MRLLLDTHVLIWWLGMTSRVGPRHRSLITDGGNTVLVSAVTIAEIAIKASTGKLQSPPDVVQQLAVHGFDELPLTARHAAAVGELPWIHRDPFDRLLIAQARIEDLTFLTADRNCRRYDVRTVNAD